MLRSAVLLSPIAHDLYNAGYIEFNPKAPMIVQVLKDICSKPGVDCTNLLTSFTGICNKNMIHISQMIRDGKVAKFDYNDKAESQKRYRQDTPPEYKMASIPHDLPLFLSYGGADALSDVQDVKLLLNSLKDHDGDKLVVLYRDDYAHADFVMGETAKQDVYDPLMAFFKLQ
ncbi:hypothetical protein M0R45_009533 [Rubus argutus]|uniref:Triacylglycerol lipase 2 n=1 Tax=Rubus argutus TaxID=59490 RepID=A0AAW1Y4P8_RUBAR